MDFTAEQQQAIAIDGHDLVVVAGAGSGKTRVLVERYLRLLGRTSPDRILAVTFTDKAAREMRERVRIALDARARAATGPERMLWEQRRAEIEAARIATIHSFCATLLRAHPAETGLDPAFTVLDEVQATIARLDAVDRALLRAVAEGHGQAALDQLAVPELRELLAALLASGGAARAALNVTPKTLPTLLDAWRAGDAELRAEVLAELLDNPAWSQAVAGLRALGPAAPAGDRIGEQVAQLQPLLESIQRQQVTPDQLSPIDTINLTGGSGKAWGAPSHLAAAKALLRTLRDLLRDVQPTLIAVWDEELEQQSAEAVLALIDLYEIASAELAHFKQQSDTLDFDDLEQRAVQLLRDYPQVRSLWCDDLEAVLVDEFQDTNATQRDLIYALAGYLDDGRAPGRLFIVGDGKQSIYRFRGAEVAVFGEVRLRIAQAGRSIALDRSFRAHERLVALLNVSFARIMAYPQPRPFQIPYEELRAVRAAPPHRRTAELHLIPPAQASSPGYSSVDAVRRYEATQVVGRLVELMRSGEPLIASRVGWRALRPGDIAILCQTSTSFEPYEEALRAAGIAFQTTAGRGYYGRSEVRDLIHLLAVIANPNDDLALAGVLRSPLCAIDDATLVAARLATPGTLWAAVRQAAQDVSAPAALTRAADLLGELRAQRGRLPVVEILEHALARTGYMASVRMLSDGARRCANIEKLVDAAREFPEASLATFAAYLETILKVEAREGEAPLEADDSVRIMTVHRAKGLEFPLVVLPETSRPQVQRTDTWLADQEGGLALRLRDQHGTWVAGSAYRALALRERQRDQAERLRLAYVALTRAQDYLILAGVTRTTSGDDWLSQIVAALDWPWEQGGPPPGTHAVADGSIDLHVVQHDAP